MEALPIRLARAIDADAIALLSRDRIESGLGWSWTANRVRRAIADAQTNVIVVEDALDLRGFGLMRYGDDAAHLLLLAVHARHARRGIGSALLAWLERSARVAGVASIQLETRQGNAAARAFYAYHGYRETQIVPGYYQGREASVRFGKSLRAGQPSVS